MHRIVTEGIATMTNEQAKLLKKKQTKEQIQEGKYDLFEEFLAKIKKKVGADFPVDAPLSLLKQNALMLFCIARDKRGVELMLRLGASLNAVDEFHRTPLHYLVQ